MVRHQPFNHWPWAQSLAGLAPTHEVTWWQTLENHAPSLSTVKPSQAMTTHFSAWRRKAQPEHYGRPSNHCSFGEQTEIPPRKEGPFAQSFEFFKKRKNREETEGRFCERVVLARVVLANVPSFRFLGSVVPFFVPSFQFLVSVVPFFVPSFQFWGVTTEGKFLTRGDLFRRVRKRRGIQKSMGNKVPWKTGMLIYLPATSRPLILKFLQTEAILSPCNFATNHLTACVLNSYLPLTSRPMKQRTLSQHPNIRKKILAPMKI